MTNKEKVLKLKQLVEQYGEKEEETYKSPHIIHFRHYDMDPKERAKFNLSKYYKWLKMDASEILFIETNDVEDEQLWILADKIDRMREKLGSYYDDAIDNLEILKTPTKTNRVKAKEAVDFYQQLVANQHQIDQMQVASEQLSRRESIAWSGVYQSINWFEEDQS